MSLIEDRTKIVFCRNQKEFEQFFDYLEKYNKKAYNYFLGIKYQPPICFRLSVFDGKEEFGFALSPDFYKLRGYCVLDFDDFYDKIIKKKKRKVKILDKDVKEIICDDEKIIEDVKFLLKNSNKFKSILKNLIKVLNV